MKNTIMWQKPQWKHGFGGKMNHLAIGTQEHSSGAHRTMFACNSFSDFARDQDFLKKRCPKCQAAEQKRAVDVCPVCFGDQYLVYNDGLMHPCPACKGTGKRN